MNAFRSIFRLPAQALMVALVVCFALVQPGMSTGLPPKTVRISGPAAIDGYVVNYAIASTGEYAVYTTHRPADGTDRLYSVRLSTGTISPLTPPLPSGEIGYVISPDGSRVIYTAKQEINNSSLHSIPIQGGEDAAHLSGAGYDVFVFSISPDSRWIVYRAMDGNSHEHLYRVAPDGTFYTAEEFVFPGAANPHFYPLSITPDSLHIVFAGYLNGPADQGIFSLPIQGTGSQAVRLSTDFTSEHLYYVVSPDGQQVVYGWTGGNTVENRVYLVPIDGPASESVLISGDLVPTAMISGVSFSPDGKHVVFSADKDTLHKDELYSVSLTGGLELPPTPVKLNLPLFGGVMWGNFVISPDGQRVAYQADMGNPRDVFIVPVDRPASANIQVSQPRPCDPRIDAGVSIPMVFTPDSRQLIFASNLEEEDPCDYELYSIPVGSPASAAVRLSQSWDFSRFLVSQNGAFIFYTEKNTPYKTNLFRVPVTGPASASLNLSQFVDNTVNEFALSPGLVPGSQQVVFIRRVEATSDNDELFLSGYTADTYLPMIGK